MVRAKNLAQLAFTFQKKFIFCQRILLFSNSPLDYIFPFKLTSISGKTVLIVHPYCV